MVKREEIVHAANLIKIDLEDHEKYIEQVEKILKYFDILDKASTGSDNFVTQELSLERLRDDKYIPYNEKLIGQLKNYKGVFVKAPKMV
ncbi:MAG: Asp-tRNA(Asn)/Glu-tRNA(Gln) amidotransferase subunit GatC [Nitrosopumilaceae archaeon]